MLIALKTVFPIFAFIVTGCNMLSGTSGDRSNQENQNADKTSQTQVYKCDNYKFSTNINSDEVTLYLPSRTVVLDKVRAASGAKYQNSDIMFWTKGDRALLEIKGKTYNCQRNTLLEPRITGGKRPVDFRAIGNEPGWLVEIVDGHSIRILTDYGNNKVATSAPSPQLTEKAKIYEAETEAHKIRIVIVQQPCTDTMSGEQFESQVTIDLDGETFTGCGQSF